MTTYNSLAFALQKLSELEDFKLMTDPNKGLSIQAEGIVFYCSRLCLEEDIQEARIFIEARIEARRLIQQEAKIVLPFDNCKQDRS